MTLLHHTEVPGLSELGEERGSAFLGALDPTFGMNDSLPQI